MNVGLDMKAREVYFPNGTRIPFSEWYSLPLPNKIVEMRTRQVPPIVPGDPLHPVCQTVIADPTCDGCGRPSSDDPCKHCGAPYGKLPGLAGIAAHERAREIALDYERAVEQAERIRWEALASLDSEEDPR